MPGKVLISSDAREAKWRQGGRKGVIGVAGSGRRIEASDARINPRAKGIGRRG
jgi:hypothetical protein